MAVRTSYDNVKVIINTEVSQTDIEAMIVTANTYLNAIVWKAEIAEDLLTDIETWLTAHIISISKDRTTIKEKVGEAQVDFVNQFGQGLKSSQYGQMCIVLDTSGTLLELSEGKKQASINAVTSFD